MLKALSISYGEHWNSRSYCKLPYIIISSQDGAMALYFAVNEGFYEVTKLLVEQHTQQAVGLDLVVKVCKLLYYVR